MAKMDLNTKLLIVAGVLGIAAGARWFATRGSYETGETEASAKELFAGFKSDEVTAISIVAPEEKGAELAKDGERWVVASDSGFRADKLDVDRVLRAVDEMRKGRVVSQKGERLDTYDLQDAKAVHVKVWGKDGKAGAPVADFKVGKNTNDFRGAYVQVAGETAVREVDQGRTEFEPGTDNTWRDKAIIDHPDADKDKIEQIELVGPTGAIALGREKVMGPKADPAAAGGEPGAEGATPPAAPEMEVKEVVWNVLAPNTGRAKKWICDQLVSQLNKLECDTFYKGPTGPEGAAALGLDPPQVTVRVRREGETEAKTLFLLGTKDKDGRVPVKLPDGDTIWLIASWKSEYFTKTVDDLLDAPPPAPDAPKDGASDAGATPPADGATPPAEPPKGGEGAPPPADPPKEGNGSSPPPAPADPPKDGEGAPPAKPDGGGGGG